MYDIPRVLRNVKFQYFSFVNVVTMPSIYSNNLKLLYLSLYVINNSLKLRQIETVVNLRQICSLNLRRSPLCSSFTTHASNSITQCAYTNARSLWRGFWATRSQSCPTVNWLRVDLKHKQHLERDHFT